MRTSSLRNKVRKIAPNLFSEIESIAENWCTRITKKLESLEGTPTASPKTITDPVLGAIELFEWEILLLDSPFLQRLRGIRQLGMVHLVYPGATHDRLGHTLGVVEVADRMIAALKRNAHNRSQYGKERDDNIPKPKDEDRFIVRLAALLHDIGHGPFSHASEEIIENIYADELEKLNSLFRQEFEGACGVKPSEAIAVLIVLTESLGKIFGHSRFNIPVREKEGLPVTLVALILGAKGGDLGAPYIYQLVSGPIDADKLDYMARDSQFSGLPMGLDIDRLIKKLEIVEINSDNATNQLLRAKVDESPGGRIYEMGISLAGLTAYEQMIVGRAMLYDRIYFHHKVRSAEAMVRKLFHATARTQNLDLATIISEFSDEATLFLLGGELKTDSFSAESEDAMDLARSLRNRDIYVRAFAFAERFIGGLSGLPKEEDRETRAGVWDEILETIRAADGFEILEKAIVEKANFLISKISDFADSEVSILDHEVIVDLPEDRVTTGARTLPMRTEGGKLQSANLFFNPDKWSDAFKNQKQCGFVFTKKEYQPIVWLASQIVFFERFGIVMMRDAHHFCKTDSLFNEKPGQWLSESDSLELCSSECTDALKEERPRLIRLLDRHLAELPEGWLKEDPGLAGRWAKEFYNILPGGLVASFFNSFLDSLIGLSHLISAFEANGQFKANAKPDEKKDLQSEMLKILRARGIQAREGEEISGGESDIVLPGNIVVENKVIGATKDPFDQANDAEWQARRYAISLNHRVSFVVLAYKPATENSYLSIPQRIRFVKQESTEPRLIVKVAIPWGYGIPSSAKAPPKKTKRNSAKKGKQKNLP